MMTKTRFILWVALLILAGGLSFGVDHTFAQEPQPFDPVVECIDCHEEEVNDWQTSRHAQAFHDDTFQQAWLDQQQPAECLTCHSHGFFNRTTQTEWHQSVPCQACHGEIPENHADEPELAPVNPQVCGDCHTTTFVEWQHSGHADQEQACETCHVPHTQKLVKESADAVCLDCHETLPANYSHDTHPEESCVGCHVFQGENNPNHSLDGNLIATGHDNLVTPLACADCHANLASESGELAELTGQSLLESQVQIMELESEVKTVAAQRSNTLAVSTIQGAILGLVMGSLGMLAFSRLRRK